MSLTRWLTDYLFIPLGGSRVALPRVYMNVLLTMLISGLWHGAGLNFLVWGLWHGAALCIHRGWGRWQGSAPTADGPFRKCLSWALTMITVTLGWAFFVMDLPTALYFFQRLLFLDGP